MTELEDKVRKLLGVKPYDQDTNYCKNDGYFAQSIRHEYGDKAVDEMIAQVRCAGTDGNVRHNRASSIYGFVPVLSKDEPMVSKRNVELELEVNDILYRYSRWQGSLKFVQNMAAHWEIEHIKVTQELLYYYDLPFTVGEFKTLVRWLKSKEELE